MDSRGLNSIRKSRERTVNQSQDDHWHSGALKNIWTAVSSLETMTWRRGRCCAVSKLQECPNRFQLGSRQTWCVCLAIPVQQSALTDVHTNYSVVGLVIGEWFGHDEESVKIIVRAVCLSSSKAKHEMVVQRTYSKVIVGLPGLEPGTNGLKDRYSNQLS